MLVILGVVVFIVKKPPVHALVYLMWLRPEMFTHDVNCLTLAPVTFARVRPPGALSAAETPAVNTRATNNDDTRGAGVVFI